MDRISIRDPILLRNQKYTSHNYQVVNLLTEEECVLISYTFGKKFYDKLSTSEKYNDHEFDKWHFADSRSDPEIKKIDDMILERIMKVNDEFFKFEITSAIDTKYVVYETGDRIDWHIDGPIGITQEIPSVWRKLSVSIALNDESEYEGGDFNMVVPNSPNTCIQTLRMGRGDAVFFPPYLAHNVSPVLKGTRKVLVYWMCGPRWK